MIKTMKRLTALLLALLLLLSCFAFAEDDTETEETFDTETEETAETETEEEPEAEPEAQPEDETVTEKDGWHFNAKGFLTGNDNPGEEYLVEDEKNGVWEYASRNLSVKVTRFEEKTKKKKKQIYVVAEVWASEESPLGAIQSDPKSSLKFKGEALPGIEQRVVTDLIEKHPSVLALSDDMYGLRITPVGKGKTKYDYHGVVIRNGEVIATKTRNSQKKRPWPNMDTLAVNKDGSMKSYDCDALTAEEYLEKGAVHVFAFGPWLISDGEINPNLAKINNYSEPRAGIGMVEPFHYIIVVTAGRPTSKYQGYKLTWLAEKMQEYGCTEALNLDGGGTACMFFNGKVVIQGQPNLRSMGSMISFGLKEETNKE
jgi:Exopolysaccharide biosynthesis protein related to N-acetylglucosamine-1-phosphodiester alpha-N-acetylglucosaminidase